MQSWSPTLPDRGPRYLAIADAIAADVRAGALGAGTRLPTHRDLARQLGVTVGTITRAYAEAERRGLIVGEVGRGTFVRSGHDEHELVRSAPRNGCSSATGVDLSLSCPWVPPDGEEGAQLAATLSQIAAGTGHDELLSFDPMTASERHRTVAARWISTMGHAVSPDHIVVTGGAQHAIHVLLASLLRPGDTVAAEAVTYPGLRAVAQTLGLKLRPLAMDDEGILPDALEEACRDSMVRAAYCIPTLQNPTSATMSRTRREQIAEIVRRHDLLVLEDEIHVAHHPERIPPLAHYAPEQTLLITTLCKWVSFGLRIGFVACPGHLLERVRSGLRASCWMAAPLMAEIATRWIEDGTAERLGRRKLEELEARHVIAREELRDVERRTASRSMNLWIRLPDGIRSDECVAQAEQRGVRVAGAEAFAVGRDVPQAVRVSLSAVPTREELRRGLRVLADVLESPTSPCSRIL